MESEYVPSQHWGEVYLAGRENKQHIAKYLIVYICNLQHMILHLDACRTLNPFQNNNNIFTINAIFCFTGNMVVSKRFDWKFIFRIFLYEMATMRKICSRFTLRFHAINIKFVSSSDSRNCDFLKIFQMFSLLSIFYSQKSNSNFQLIENVYENTSKFRIKGHFFLFLFCIYIKALQNVINKNERQNKRFGTSK